MYLCNQQTRIPARGTDGSPAANDSNDTMEELKGPIAEWLSGIGWSQVHIDWTAKIIILAGIVILSWGAAKLFRGVVVPVLQRLSRSTKATWDDYLFSDRVMRAAARLIPPLIWYMLLAAAFYDMPQLLDLLRKVCLIYLIVAVLLLVNAFLDTLHDISAQHETLRNRPLKGIYQMVKLLAFCVEPWARAWAPSATCSAVRWPEKRPSHSSEMMAMMFSS